MGARELGPRLRSRVPVSRRLKVPGAQVPVSFLIWLQGCFHFQGKCSHLSAQSRGPEGMPLVLREREELCFLFFLL